MYILPRGRSTVTAAAMGLFLVPLMASSPTMAACKTGASSCLQSTTSARVLTTATKARLVKRSMSAAKVRRLQRRLKKMGYLAGAVDGIYGPQTRRAVSKMRRARKLKRSTRRHARKKYSKSRTRRKAGRSYRGHKGRLMAVLRRVKPKGLPLRLAAAVITVESNWKVNARGSSGERGLMQLMPATARSFGARGNLYNPTTNLRVGSKYLHYCYKRAKRNVAATIGCYNRGPGKMWKWSGNPITRKYVSRVRRMIGRRG